LGDAGLQQLRENVNEIFMPIVAFAPQAIE
jgi:hypothetical protein